MEPTEGQRKQAGKPRGSIGRPKAARVRDHWVSFRVTGEEHMTLMLKAQKSDTTAGEYARSRAMRGLVRPKKTPATEPIFGAETRAVFHELRRQGVNLNQIAHHCNTLKVPPPPEMTELARVMLALWQRLLSS